MRITYTGRSTFVASVAAHPFSPIYVSAFGAIPIGKSEIGGETFALAFAPHEEEQLV